MHCSKWYNQHITSSQWICIINTGSIQTSEITAQMRGCFQFLNHYNNSGEFGSIYITRLELYLSHAINQKNPCAASYCVILLWFCFSSFFSPMIWIWNDLILHTAYIDSVVVPDISCLNQSESDIKQNRWHQKTHRSG